jgi:short-subunit dehydrogenase
MFVCFLSTAFVLVGLGVASLLLYRRFTKPAKRDPSYLKKTFGGWALITGASSGLGKDMAFILAGEGYDVILSARRKEVLEEIAKEIQQKYKVQTKVVPSDLGSRDGPHTLYETVVNEMKLDVGILINNAGAGWFGYIQEQDPAAIEAMIQLNCTSMAVLTHLFVKSMKQRSQEAAILITSSLGSYMPIPFSSTYASAKAMVSMFGVAVAQEQIGTNSNVRICVLEPGATATGFADVAAQTTGINATRTDMASSSEVSDIALDYLAAKKPICVPIDKDYYLTILSGILPKPTAALFAFNKYKTLMESVKGKK